ncbi:MAG: hypothetical protein GF330_05705 [Candidatus Eisenbacteria bacterium]|nr:hypothetical protein [Candidatus Eisenbacteria bacterium]
MDRIGVPPERRPRALPWILLALLLLRWYLATLPGYPPDLTTYKRWALTAALEGVHTIYDDPQTTYDYPPLYGLLLTPVGHLYHAIAPQAAESRGDSATFSILVKLPPQIFDLLTALLLATLAFRKKLWPPGRARRGWLPALLYLAFPAVLFDTTYWGQPDSIHTLFVLLALTLILRGRPEWGWAAAAWACLMKPLALPFLPLLAVATIVRSGWVRLCSGGLAAGAAGLLVFVPFLVTGRGALVFERLISDATLMPYTSVNSHNLWWLIGSWRNASVPWIGPLTPTLFGLILFGLAYLGALGLALQIEWKRAGRAPIGRGAHPLGEQMHWYIAFTAVAFSFFLFSTHMHENHLFAALPGLILLAGLGKRWAWLCALVGFSALVNMAIHDLHLAHALWMRIGGPSAFYHPDLARPLSRFELWTANLNAALLVLLFGAFVALAARRLLRDARGALRLGDRLETQ